MFALLMVVLAMAGVSLPEDKNEFYVIGSGSKPMILTLEEEDLWAAKFVDHQSQQYIPTGRYHLNGLAIGHDRDDGSGFQYSDVTEIVPINSLADLMELEQLKVSGGTLYVRHEENKITLDYSPDAITSRSLSVTAFWKAQ